MHRRGGDSTACRHDGVGGAEDGGKDGQIQVERQVGHSEESDHLRRRHGEREQCGQDDERDKHLQRTALQHARGRVHKHPAKRLSDLGFRREGRDEEGAVSRNDSVGPIIVVLRADRLVGLKLNLGAD